MRNVSLCSLVLIGTLGTAFVPWQPLDSSAQAGYVTAVLADNPTAYWRFEDSPIVAGQPAADTTGNSTNDAYAGGVSPSIDTPGVIGGQSLTLDGADAYVTLGQDLRGMVNGASAVTVEAWVKNASFPASGTSYFLFSNMVDSAYTGFRLAVNPIDSSSAQFHFAGRPQASDSFAGGGATFNSTGQWRHVVGVMDYANKQVDVYLDGSLASSTPITSGWNATSYTAGASAITNDTIGAFHASSGYERFFDGSVDEVAVYNTALGARDIWAHYAVGNGLLPVADNLVVWLDAGNVDGEGNNPANGAAVGEWANRVAGSAGNAVTAGAAPTYVTDAGAALNNMPALRFDGTAGLKIDHDAVLNATEGLTIFAVAKRDDGFRLMQKGDGGGANRDDWFMAPTSGMGVAGNHRGAVIGDIVSGGTYVFASQYDPDSAPHGRILDWLDGELRDDGVWLTSDYLSTNTDDLYIGRRNNAGGSEGFLTGDLAEILVFNSVLSASDRYAVGQYLQTKYGIQQAGYVPEPSVALMLAIAAFQLLLLRRRARR